MAVLQLLTLVLLELVQLIYLSEASSLSTIVLLRASRSNSYRGRRMYDEQEYNEFNEDLEITKVTYADEIVRNASPIVVLQSENGTVVAYARRNVTYELVGVDFVTFLDHKSVAVAVTGALSDCFDALQNIREYTLNMTLSTGFVPSGEHLSLKFATYFGESTRGRRIPFSCHAFIIDMRTWPSQGINGTIYEIKPSGERIQVYGGVVGIGSDKNRKLTGQTGTPSNMNISAGGDSKYPEQISSIDLLENRFRKEMNLVDTVSLAKEVLQKCLQTESTASESMLVTDEDNVSQVIGWNPIEFTIIPSVNCEELESTQLGELWNQGCGGYNPSASE